MDPAPSFFAPHLDAASANSFPIDAVLAIIRRLARRWEAPAVHDYRETPFTILVSCLLSLRTQDKTTDAASARLFAVARTPEAIRRLPLSRLERLIYPVGFYRVKSRTLQNLCAVLIDDFGGAVPETIEELLRLPGVGRKTANLVITLGFRRPGICVDTHVHRIVNRWGYVRTRSPDETELRLRKKLPRRYWIGLNEWLVGFGQRLCQPISPFCSTCPVSEACRRIGVTRHR